MAQLRKPVRVGSAAPKITTDNGTLQDETVVRAQAPTMTLEDQRSLEAAKKGWEYGNKTGNQHLMKTAHDQAEAIRAKYGFSGGSDGAAVIPLENATGPLTASSVTRQPVWNGTVEKPAGTTTQQAAENLQQAANAASGAKNTTTNRTLYNIVQQMRANGDAWHQTQDAAERKRLSDTNEKLAAQYFPGAYKTDSGIWYYNGAPLYELGYQDTSIETPETGYASVEEDTALQRLAADMDAARQAVGQNGFDYQGRDLSAEEAALQRAADALNIAETPFVGADLSGLQGDVDAAADAAARAGAFDYQGRDLSAQEAALDAAAAELANREGFSYQGRDLSDLEARVQAASDGLINRDAFSYDPRKDPAYLAYEQIYTNRGRRAMEDTLGQVAARTGGMASSYAVSASQQAYNNYMQELAAQIPALQQAAYSMYLGDLNQRRADYDMLSAQYQNAQAADLAARDFAYQDYRNQIGDAWNQYNARSDRYQQALAQENADRAFAYGQSRDAVSDAQWRYGQAYGRYQDALAQNNADRAFDYQRGRDRVADAQWSHNAALDRLQYAAQQAAADRNFAYQQNRDAVSDRQWQYGAAADRYAQALAQRNLDREFAYQQGRDAVSDQQWNIQQAYNAERDAEADRRYNQEWAYGISRDQVADARYDREWDYGVSRDQVADERYAQEWQHTLTQDERDYLLRQAALELDRQQYGLSLDKFAWQQGQDAFDNSLATQKFNYTQSQDAISNAQAAQRLALQQQQVDLKANAAQKAAEAEQAKKVAEAAAAAVKATQERIKSTVSAKKKATTKEKRLSK